MTAHREAALLCLACILCWGLWGFLGKLALERGMPPMGIFIAEVSVSMLLALGIGVGQMNAGRFFASWNWFGVLSGIGLAAGLVCYYFALGRASASVVVPLTSLYPAITVVLGRLVLSERLGPWQVLGLVLAIAGGALLLIPNER